MTTDQENIQSPRWGSTIKLVVGLTLFLILGFLLVRFRTLIGPLLLAFIVAFVLHPAAGWLTEKTPLTWRTSVTIVFFSTVILVGGMLTVLGFAVVAQSENVINAASVFLDDLPAFVTQITSQSYYFGPFTFDFSQYDITTITNQVVDVVQPLLGRAGGLISSLATSTLTTLGYGSFVLLVSYFILADAEKIPVDEITNLNVPKYAYDLQQFSLRLNRIWDTFMRGQLFIFTLTVLASTVLLSILGVRNAIALALLAGMARFVPYVGQIVSWALTAIVTLFMSSNYFGLEQVHYMLLVVGIVILLDQITDNIIIPRLYGRALGVHPAAVLVGALVALNLLGFIGLLLAAPVLATIALISRYIFRKLLDLDPWNELSNEDEANASYPGFGAMLAAVSRSKIRFFEYIQTRRSQSKKTKKRRKR